MWSITNRGTRHVVTSVLDNLNVRSEHFDSLPEMLTRYKLARPDLLIVDVTVSSAEARRYAEMLVGASVSCPVRIMSGLNGRAKLFVGA